MTRDEKVEIIEKFLGRGGYNMGHAIGLFDAAYGMGLSVGAKMVRKIYNEPSKPAVKKIARRGAKR